MNADTVNDTEDELSAVNGSFNISLVSDNSDDDFDRSLDASILSTPARLSSSPAVDIVRGLGIIGISNKDGHGIFDGLGVISVRSSPWRHCNNGEQSQQDSFQEGHSASSIPNDDNCLATETSDWNLSTTFLQETLFTFTEDPFHGHSLAVIPECESWYELEDIHRPSSSVTMMCRKHDLEPMPNLPSEFNNGQSKRPMMLTRNVSASTISSELKRSTSLHCYKSPRASITGCASRSLSTSLSGEPSQVTGKMLRSRSLSGSKSPLPRCTTPLASPKSGTPRWRI